MAISKESFIHNYNKMTVQQMASLYGVTRMTIWRKTKQLGLSKKKSTKSKFDF